MISRFEMKYPGWIAFILFLLSSAACISGPVISSAVTPAPPDSTLIPAAPSLVPPSDTGKPASAPWWPADLAIPKTGELTTSTKTQAIWTTRDLNVDGIKDFFLREAGAAGYTAYTIPLSPGSIYDLLLVKNGSAYALNLTQGTESTIITGQHVGTMHVKVTGAVDLELDLPLRERFDLRPGNEIAFGTSVPNTARCSGCEYLVYVHVAPFQGPGTYRTKPAGISIIDIQLVPGGREGEDDFRWAQECTLIVQNALGGNFACAGLQNINDGNQRVNVIASWQEPP